MNYDIDKLINNKTYTYDELKFIIDGFMNGSINDEKMTLWLRRVCKKTLSIEETINLTDIYVNSGEKLDLSLLKRPTVDKHSTGGIGDKVSIIVGPIVAALGIAVPKMSGRGLGYTGGTIDKLESIDGYRTSLTKEEFLNELQTINMSIISQTESITPADKKTYALRDVTNTVESISLIAASVMSKKIAVGADAIVIDLKVGKGAFMKKLKEAKELAKYITKIGEYYKKRVKIVITSMDRPLGRCVGNNLEILEAMEFFDNKWSKDLGEVVLTIAAEMVKCAKNIPYEEAMKQVRGTISDGSARSKFYQWIAFQGGDIKTVIKPCKRFVIKSNKKGYIKDIDALSIGSLVRDLGGGRKKKEDGIDHAVGVKLLKDIGDHVDLEEAIAEIYLNEVIPDIESRALSSFKISAFKVKPKSTILMIL